MKKFRLLISLLVTFTMIFAYAGIVKADETEETFTNIFDGATFEIVNDDDDDYFNLELHVENVNWNATNTNLYRETNYRVFYSNDDNLSKEYLIENIGDANPISILNLEKREAVIDKFNIDGEVEKDGNLYLYIVYYPTSTALDEEIKVVVDACNLAKPPVSKYTKIFPSWMFASKDRVQVGLLIPHDADNTRKLQVKIGKIADDSLLKKLSENPEASWEELKTYAKNSTGLYDKLNDANADDTLMWSAEEELIKKESIEDGGYYYLYLRADSNNGKYTEYDGVTITQAYVSNVFDWWSMHFYGNGEFKWKDFNGGETPESNVIIVNDINGDMSTADKPIPQTGDESKLVIGSAIVLMAAGYVLYRKYKNTQIK